MQLRPLLALLVTLAPHAVLAQRIRSAAPALSTSRILWIGAHPDDESLLAPVLGSLCVENGADCRLLVMTRGENGVCRLPQGCADLGSTRIAELTAAAALLHSSVEVWRLPDVMAGVDEAWDLASGGHEPLLEALRTSIDAFSPSMIVTFDPAHGSTCHPAHRSIGSLVLEAAPGRNTYLLETRAEFDDGAYALSRAIVDGPPSIAFGDPRAWHFIVDDLRVYASQFDPKTIESVSAAVDRSVVLIPARAAGVHYQQPCP